MGLHSAEADVDFLYPEHDDNAREYRREYLPDNSCRRRARNAHCGQTEPAENQYRVKDNVDDGADKLRYHAPRGVACALHYSLAVDLHEKPEAEAGDGPQIIRAHFADFRIVSHGGEKYLRKEKPEDEERGIAAHGKKEALIRGGFGGGKVLFAELAGHEAAHADARSYGNCYHKHLNGERKGESLGGVLAYPRDKNAVYYIIESLHEVRHDKRQRHSDDKPLYRHCSKLVFFC